MFIRATGRGQRDTIGGRLIIMSNVSSRNLEREPQELSVNIIGDSFADVFCYLSAALPKLGGDSRLLEPVRTKAGGSGLNTATHLASLLGQFSPPSSSFDVSLQTVINENDIHGRLLIDHCRRHDITLLNRRVSDVPSCFSGTGQETVDSIDATPHCVVIVAQNDRSFMSYLGCLSKFSGDDVLPLINSTALNVVHVAGYFNLPRFWNGSLARKLRELRGYAESKGPCDLLISMVPQQDATEQYDGGVKEVLKLIDILILSEVEAKGMTKYQEIANDINGNREIEDHVAAFFAPYTSLLVVVTLGIEGAVALRGGRIVHRQRTYRRNNPIDPVRACKYYAYMVHPNLILHNRLQTGAGDSFSAGFLFGYVKRGADEDAIAEGMKFGCALGSNNVMIQGASIPASKPSIESTIALL